MIASRPGWNRTNESFVWLSPGEKKMEPNQLFLICIWWWILLWLILVSVKMLMPLFFFCKTQVPDPASRDLWCHQHCHISCSNYWKIRRKKVPWFSFTFSLVMKIVLDLLKWLKETSFYEKKKRIIMKTWPLHKKKVHIKKKESSWIFRIKEKLILKKIFL